VDYQTGAPQCPRCGSSADVRTARELFDTMNSAQGQGLQRFSQYFGGAGQAPGQGQTPGQGQFPSQGQPAGPEASPGEGRLPHESFLGPGQAAAPGQAAGPGGFPQGQFFGQGQDQGQPAGPGGFPQGQFFGQGQDQGQPPASAPGPGQSPAPDQPPTQPQPPNQGQAPGQWQAPGQGQNTGQDWNRADDNDYDHYNADSSGSGLRGFRNRGRGRGFDIFHPVDSVADDIGGAVADAALGFIGRRVKKAFEEKVMPAVQAKLEQTQQQAGQQRAEQDAIVARYPELRACTRDQVIFLVDGYQTIPVSELKMPVTLAQADDVVARLR
jgi:hypothetical protein